MCTLVAAVRSWPGHPLVIAANRDERLARPAVPPFLWPGPPRFVAPRDELAGGSWLGLNEHGVFVGVTNRAGALRDPSRRSRGALVIDALSAPSAAALHQTLASLDHGAYNPFHLLYADRETAHVTWCDGETVHRADLGAGLHVVTEQSTGTAHADTTPRASFIRDAWQRDVAGRELSVARIEALLREHAGHPLEGTCVHADAVGYGTRSSAVLVLGDAAGDVTMLWAEGKPCVTPFEDQRRLLEQLAAG